MDDYWEQDALDDDSAWYLNAPVVDEAESHTDVKPDTEHDLHSATRFGTMQLGLFGEAVPLARPCGTGRALQTVAHPPRNGGRFQSLKQSNQDALAVVSLLFPQTDGLEPPMDQARALLSGQATGDLREIALGAAWIAVEGLRILDEVEPSLGTELLEDFGLWLAQFTGGDADLGLR